MAARSILFCGAVLLTMIPAGWASEVGESGATVEIAVAAAATALNPVAVDDGAEATCKPTISMKVLVPNRRKISNAFDLALEKVREVPECGEMFAGLGSEATDALGRIVFLPVGKAQARDGVCRGSSAYTLVGGGPIWVCRDFKRLSDAQAAMIIIHEALHHAGLTEYPKDEDAMTSRDINFVVKEQCGL